jgi:hypothetical protein
MKLQHIVNYGCPNNRYVSMEARGDNIADVFFRDWEKQFALIRLDTWGDANAVVVYHEYARSILHANAHWLPIWLDKGLAEFYAYTRFEKDRTYVELSLVEWKLGLMQQANNDVHQAETLEPWRAGYHLLTGRILLRGNKPAVAANYAQYVATHWFGPDHDEAFDLWQAIPPEQRGDGLVRGYPGISQVHRHPDARQGRRETSYIHQRWPHARRLFRHSLVR